MYNLKYLKTTLPIFYIKNSKFKVYGTIIYYKNKNFNNKSNLIKTNYFVLTGFKTDNSFFSESLRQTKVNSYMFNISNKFSPWNFEKFYYFYYKNLLKFYSFNKFCNLLKSRVIKYNFKILSQNFISYNLKSKKKKTLNYYNNLINTFCNTGRFFNANNILIYIKENNNIFSILSNKKSVNIFQNKKKNMSVWNLLGLKQNYLINKKNYWKYFFHKKYVLYNISYLLKLTKNYMLIKSNSIYLNIIYLLYCTYLLKRAIFLNKKNKYKVIKSVKSTFIKSNLNFTDLNININLNYLFLLKNKRTLEIIKCFVINFENFQNFTNFYIDVIKYLNNLNLNKLKSSFDLVNLKHVSFLYNSKVRLTYIK